jgi:hypothetical protein
MGAVMKDRQLQVARTGNCDCNTNWQPNNACFSSDRYRYYANDQTSSESSESSRYTTALRPPR